ncbi:hypothetical protein ACFSTC_51540 [Nonomuraea ferruginea]
MVLGAAWAVVGGVVSFRKMWSSGIESPDTRPSSTPVSRAVASRPTAPRWFRRRMGRWVCRV